MSQEKYTDTIVWLPTFNEEMSVAKMIFDIRELGFEVRLTDGGSTDNTVAIAQEADVKVLMRSGKHKGFGIQRALEESSKQGFKKMIYIDCDQTYPVSKLPEIYELGKTYDMVIGARDFSKIALPNRMANHLFTGLINLLFRANLADTQSGLRLLSVSAFEGRLHSSAFDIETELSCLSLKRKLKMIELPIDYFERVGESKTSVIQALIILKRIFICRFIN